jgi:hypothetical protein
MLFICFRIWIQCYISVFLYFTSFCYFLLSLENSFMKDFLFFFRLIDTVKSRSRCIPLSKHLTKRQAEQLRRVSNVISQLRCLRHRNVAYAQKPLLIRWSLNTYTNRWIIVQLLTILSIKRKPLDRFSLYASLNSENKISLWTPFSLNTLQYLFIWEKFSSRLVFVLLYIVLSNLRFSYVWELKTIIKISNISYFAILAFQVWELLLPDGLDF